MSSSVRPARFSAFWVAGTGPVPITAGSAEFVRTLTDGLEYQRHEGKNLLVLKKRLL